MLETINKFDLNIVKWIENNLRSNFLDVLFQVITELGDKFVFILIVIVLFWAVDKRFAYKFLFAFLLSAILNTIIKVIVKRPRPYDKGISSVGSKTSGYSFPSGHSQATGVIYYSIKEEYANKNKLVNGLLIALLILVPFSRIYLGQHYLTDVIVGAIIGIGMSILAFKLFDLMKDKEHIYPLYGIPFIIIALIIFLKSDYNKVSEIYVAGAGYIGFAVGYAIEKLYIKHNVNTNIKNRILKVIIGLIIVAVTYFGLKLWFDSINDLSVVLDFIRYFVLTITATTLIPYIFTKIFKE